MATIDGLFEQIIHSEKAAIKKKYLFQELRQAVFTAREHGKKLEQTHIHLQRTLKDKFEDLSSKELTVKWLMSREKVYMEEKANIETKIMDLEHKQQELKELCVRENTKFCESVSTFCDQFGLGSSGFEDRQKQLQDKLTTLTRQRDTLKTEVDQLEEQASSVQKLMGEKTSLSAQLEKLKSENDRIVSNLYDELQKSTELEEACQTVTHHPYSDPQFTSLQRQLEEEKASSVRLDQTSTALQTELHNLHENMWKRQLRQRQQQKLQQQQQQQQNLQHRQQQQQQQQWQQQEMASEECSNEVLEKMFSDSEEFSDPDLESKGQTPCIRGQGHSKDDLESKGHLSNNLKNVDVSGIQDMNIDTEDVNQSEISETQGKDSKGTSKGSVVLCANDVSSTGNSVSQKRMIFKRS